MTASAPATRAGRRMVPETVHACAFLSYLLAGGLLAELSIVHQMIELGLLAADDWDGIQPVVLLLALPMLAAAVAVHWGVRQARPVLAVAAWLLAAFLVILAIGVAGLSSVPATVWLAILVNAVAAVVVARLPYGQDADAYLRGRGLSRAEARTAARARGRAPGGVVLAAVCLGSAALVGVIAMVDLAVNAGGSAMPPLAIAAMAVALVRGLLKGRLWARAYAVTLLALALAAGTVTVIGLWRASIPRHDLLASAPPDVGPAVLTALLVMAVDAVLLYALAWKDTSIDYFTAGW
ncbi:hypothetical protein ACFYUV_50110 [Nonomuraea sp. NPDC003560]|uniref:hypothetical protein n=1 Tax=Nonomuraea sp. NPDC003560 TaxID=3364341 RepID=UPI003681A442